MNSTHRPLHRRARSARRALGLLVLPLASTTGCSGNFNTLAGYHFTYEGTVAERSASAAIDPEVRSITVDHRFGELSVVGVAEGEPAGWNWRLEAWAETPAEAEEWLARIFLVVDRAFHEQTWTLELPDAPAYGLRGVRSTLELRIAPDASVVVLNRHGATRVAGLDGSVELESEHGDVVLDALTGAYVGRHAHGDLTGTQLGRATVASRHGDVHLVDIAGELDSTGSHGALQFERVAGRLSIEHAHGGVVVREAAATRIEAAHGRLELDGVAGLELESRHGDVVARLTGGELAARVAHGNLSVRAGAEPAADATADRGAFERGRVECRHGDVHIDLFSAADLDLDVEHGDIEIVHPAGLRALLDADAEHGDVTSDLPRGGADGEACVFKLATRHGHIVVRAR